MRVAPLCVVDDEQVFDDIAAAKRPPRKARLRSARRDVFDAYQRYSAVVPDLGDLERARITANQKEALLHAYSVETKPMTSLRSQLTKRLLVALCPFCAISETSTLDHYLPKETYPEFAVFSRNLIPSCGVCNTRKRDLIVDEQTHVRLFLHPLYDQIPTINFLTARVRLDANALILSYKLRRPQGMAPATFQHLQSHFGLLDLADRYRRMGLSRLGDQYRALARAYGPGQDATRVAEKLKELAGDIEDDFGKNDWLANLYRVLADNDDFCDGGFEVIKVHPSLRQVANSNP